MTFLTPLAGLVALAAVLPLAAALFGRTRADGVRRGLGLEAAPARVGLLRPALAAAGIVLLGLAAAQPVLEHRSSQRVRKDVEALFVVDTSRSMAASATATSPTRLDRAIAAAARLRSSIPQVPSGVATLTDRVLPDLLPVAGVDSFDAVVRRTVAIESPPPQDSNVRATTYDTLAQIASGNYFDPYGLATDRRAAHGRREQSDRRRADRPRPAGAKGYRFVSVRFWGDGESVFDSNGKPEADYRPDSSGGALLAGLAAATGGKAFPESRLGAASSALVQDAGSGPTVVTAGETQSRFALAPFLVAAAILLLLAAIAPIPCTGSFATVR